jgi:uncharacterized small protein (DUF1192 family)
MMIMQDEDAEPLLRAQLTRKIDIVFRPSVTPPDLGPYSLEELSEYLAGLQQEISRVTAIIQQKTAHQKAAAALFSPPKP